MKTPLLYQLDKANLDHVLSRWNQTIPVYVPSGKGKDISLLPMVDFPRTDNYINLTLPVKEFFFEQKESLFRWDREGTAIKVENLSKQHSGERILYGVRACDTYGIGYTDHFFLREFEDTNYASRRDKVYIVAVNCLKAGPHCFCTSVGTGVFSTIGHDLAFTELEGFYLVESATVKGQQLIEAAADFFVPVSDEFAGDVSPGILLGMKEGLRQKVADSFPLKMDLTNLHADMAVTFDAPFWLDEANACIGCTGCTNVCPTCTCFNVVEENRDQDHGMRVRYWDSCQSDHFTRNAEFHNPRNALSRTRYRVYDKLKYIEERFGYKGCSGCGRCTDVCPTYISIIDIIHAIQKAAKEAPETPAIHQITEMRHEIFDREINVRNGLFTPDVATITKIELETPEIKRIYVKYDDPALHKHFKLNGQFFQITVFGQGEVPISIPFGPEESDEFDFCFKNVGTVSNILYHLKVGDKVGLRGPYGRPFPYEPLKGRNLVFIGSGVAMAPLRTILIQVVNNLQDFGKVVIMASALEYDKVIYKSELRDWAALEGVEVHYALKDPTDQVKAHQGYINDLLPGLELDWSNTTALVCASPKRIKEVSRDLLALGMKPTDILTTLETHMRCGAGKCGHCKVGSHYMCVDGPVFTYEEMMALPPEY